MSSARWARPTLLYRSSFAFSSSTASRKPPRRRRAPHNAAPPPYLRFLLAAGSADLRLHLDGRRLTGALATVTSTSTVPPRREPLALPAPHRPPPDLLFHLAATDLRFHLAADDLHCVDLYRGGPPAATDLQVLRAGPVPCDAADSGPTV